MKQVKDIDWNNPKYIRAGVIPYAYQGDVLFFAFGIENDVGAIGDFGGHKEDIDYDCLDSAIREYSEEALDIFGVLDRNKLKNNFVLEGKDTIELLIEVAPPLYQYTIAFRDLIGNDKTHEVQDIIWLSRDQLIEAINNPDKKFLGTKIYHMYIRLWETFRMNISLL